MRVYLDAMVWIYAFEGNSPFAAPAQQLLLHIQQSPHTVLVSHFLLAELLVVPVRRNDQFTVARYRHMLFDSAATEVVLFGTDAALRFAALRAAHRVRQPDAIHIALAATGGADAFLTGDDRLRKLIVPGIGLISDLHFRFA